MSCVKGAGSADLRQQEVVFSSCVILLSETDIRLPVETFWRRHDHLGSHLALHLVGSSVFNGGVPAGGHLEPPKSCSTKANGEPLIKSVNHINDHVSPFGISKTSFLIITTMKRCIKKEWRRSSAATG